MTSDAVDTESLQPEFNACAVVLTDVPVPAAVPDSVSTEENAVPDLPDLPAVLAAAPIAAWTAAQRAWLDGLVHALTLAPPPRGGCWPRERTAAGRAWRCSGPAWERPAAR